MFDHFDNIWPFWQFLTIWYFYPRPADSISHSVCLNVGLSVKKLILKKWNCNNSAIFEAMTSRFCMVGDQDNSFSNGGNSVMLRISGETDRYQVSYIFGTTSSSWFEWWWEFQEWWECLEFWNVGMLTISGMSGQTSSVIPFVDSQPWADDGNFKNGGIIRSVENVRRNTQT